MAVECWQQPNQQPHRLCERLTRAQASRSPEPKLGCADRRHCARSDRFARRTRRQPDPSRVRMHTGAPLLINSRSINYYSLRCLMAIVVRLASLTCCPQHCPLAKAIGSLCSEVVCRGNIVLCSSRPALQQPEQCSSGSSNNSLLLWPLLSGELGLDRHNERIGHT